MTDVFNLDNAKINNIKFDYFGDDKNIKVPTSFNFEIKGADFNYDQVSNISGGLAFLDGLIDELGYEKIKFDFKTGWKWNTKANDISFELDLGITDAASLAISTNLVDLGYKYSNNTRRSITYILNDNSKIKTITFITS